MNPVRQTIEFFAPGDAKRTMLQASVANEIVSAVNKLLLAAGDDYIVVTVAEANVRIELREEARKAIKDVIDGNLPGGGGVNFRDQWATGVDYKAGDVVIVWTLGDINQSMLAGTYIALVDHTSAPANQPPSGEVYSNATWATLARGHWSHLWSYDDTDATTQAYGAFHANGGNVTVDFGSRSFSSALGKNTTLELNNGSFGASIIDPLLRGRTFAPRLVDICDGGVSKKIWIIASEAFDP
jgi:hypothetical protein